MKVQIGWTVLRAGKPVGQIETLFGRVIGRNTVTPVYDKVSKARAKATRLGLTYAAIVPAFIEVPDERPEPQEWR